MPYRAWWRHSWGKDEGKVGGGRGGERAECIQGLHHTEACCHTVCAAASGDSALLTSILMLPTSKTCWLITRGMHHGELTSKTSSLMIRGMRMQISLTVFRPTVISSGRARSCTNWLHKCRMTGCNQSGGTKSWHACTDTHGQSVMLILRCRCVC